MSLLLLYHGYAQGAATSPVVKRKDEEEDDTLMWISIITPIIDEEKWLKTEN